MASSCWLWLRFLGQATGFAESLAQVVTTVPLGAAVFYLTGRALRIDELERLSDALRRALERRSR
jgi:hypothetical protein